MATRPDARPFLGPRTPWAHLLELAEAEDLVVVEEIERIDADTARKLLLACAWLEGGRRRAKRQEITVHMSPPEPEVRVVYVPDPRRPARW